MILKRTHEEYILSFRDFESRTARKDEFDNINEAVCNDVFDREKSDDAPRFLLISAAAFVVRAPTPFSTLPHSCSYLVLAMSSPPHLFDWM